jgi:hypothetical protein
MAFFYNKIIRYFQLDLGPALVFSLGIHFKKSNFSFYIIVYYKKFINQY